MFQDWLERLRTFWSASRRNQVIVVVSSVALIALIVGSIALLTTRGGASANGIAQATATPIQQTPTTSDPTATTGPIATAQPAKPLDLPIIGGTEAGFTAVFGKPIRTGIDSGNNLPTVDYRGSGSIGGITIELDSTKSYVVGVVVNASQNTPFDATDLQAITLHFTPTGATFDTAAPITNGANQDVALFQLGHSSLLANTIPSGAFTDYQGQQVANGTFSVEIYYIEGANGRLAYAVSLRLGNWPASPAV
jgi:hypothetical protein